MLQGPVYVSRLLVRLQKELYSDEGERARNVNKSTHVIMAGFGLSRNRLRRMASQSIGPVTAGRRSSVFGLAPVMTAPHSARKPAPRRWVTAAQASRNTGNFPHAFAIQRAQVKSRPKERCQRA